MIILHAAPVNWRKVAGLNASVPGLVAAQHALTDVEAGLLTTVVGDSEPPCQFPVFQAQTVCRNTGRPDLPAPFDRPDLVVFHSTYIPLHARIARYLRRTSIPYVICPRGGMTRYAQSCKRWKKMAGNLLFFNGVVRGAQAVHCLTRGEEEASNAWHVPSFVVGNGVQLPELSVVPKTRPLRVVFMGRLHIDHKGLDLLVDACALIEKQLAEAGVVVELYGPDCDGSADRLAARIARFDIQNVVTLQGPVVGDAKGDLLRSTDVFVHPSRTEGHPSAVLEALAHGAPCLLTPSTNMADEVVGVGAGWRVAASVEGIARGLRAVISLPEHELAKAGENARALVENAFSWPDIARRAVAEYRRFAA
jgi:glycosyltransferase involved in cell wall biosynthesis